MGIKKTLPSGAVAPAGQSCFLADCLCSDTVVHLGPKVMGTKDLDAEMAAGTPFGMKLRKIAKKVEALM